MEQKKKNHYVDKQKFLDAIKKYKEECRIAEMENLEKPRLSEYIGNCLLLITENLAIKRSFAEYSFIDQMKSDALENCLLYFDNFDTNKYNNPFAYFTQI